MNGIFSLVTPLLLHMLASNLAAAAFGSRFDATTCTAITSLIVIPIAGWMYCRDQKNGIGQQKPGTGKTELVSWKIMQKNCAEGKAMRSEKAMKNGKKWNRTVFFGVFCFLAGGVLNLGLSGIMNALHITEAFSNGTQEELLAAQPAVQIIGLGFLVPAAEELVFRGLIYSRMKGFFPVKMSVLFSALLFAVYHGNPIQMIFAFPMAIALAAVFEHGKLFIFPVLFHMGANLTAIFVNFF